MVQQEPLREAVLPQSLVKYTQSTLCFRLLTVSSSSLSGVPNSIREAPSLRLLCQTRSLWGGSNYPLCNMFACTSSSLFHREQTLVRMIEASDVLVCLPGSFFSLWLTPSFLPGILGSRPGPHCLSSSDKQLSMSGNPCAAVSRSAAVSVKPGTCCERKSPKLKIKIMFEKCKPSRSLRSGPLRQCHLKKGLNK